MEACDASSFNDEFDGVDVTLLGPHEGQVLDSRLDFVVQFPTAVHDVARSGLGEDSHRDWWPSRETKKRALTGIQASQSPFPLVAGTGFEPVTSGL